MQDTIAIVGNGRLGRALASALRKADPHGRGYAGAGADVFIANVLKCRPPGNRDPHPEEIENCQDYLLRQVELIEPRVICTLGNFATKLLRADPTGITRLHGQQEVRVIGTRAVRLYPIFHPAAALAISASGTQSRTTSAPAPAYPRPCGSGARSAEARARPRRPSPTMAIVCCI